jgi:hypothetical protein
VTSPEAALTGIDVTGSHVTGTGSHVTGSDRVRMHNQFQCIFLTIVVVQNVPLCITGSSMATGCDVIKRHVTPKGFLWKGGVRACATGSCAISDQTSHP